MKQFGRWPAFLLCFGMIFAAACGAEKKPVPERSDKEYIFVHGLSGWGSYDKTYKRMPYWGMFTGDLMKYLRSQGFSRFPRVRIFVQVLPSRLKAVPGIGPASSTRS